MHKPLFLFLLVASCMPVTSSTVVQTTPDHFEPVNRSRMRMVKRRAVQVKRSCGFDSSLMGSGVVILKEKHRTLVATAAHVTDYIIDNGCDIIVEDYTGASGFGEVIARDKTGDVSIIELDVELGEVAPLTKQPYLGQPVSCVGWPSLPFKKYSGQSITRGYVSTLDVDGFIRISADLYFGNSGGACFSDDGDVVGIVSHFMIGGQFGGVVTPAPGQFFISHVANIKKLLD